MSGKSSGSAAKARTPTAGTNTAGRDISFHIRNFTQNESNYFLYRTVFLYVCFGIPGIQTMLDLTIDRLLQKNGQITDEQVKKMIWVVCNFNHYLSNLSNYGNISSAGEFIDLLINQYYNNHDRHDTHDSLEIAESIATLVVRVFVAFQMRINLRDGTAVEQILLEPQQQANITASLNSDLRSIPPPAEIVTKLTNTAVDQTIGNISKDTEEQPPQQVNRMSSRLRLLNEAIGKAAAERKQKAEEAKDKEQAEKDRKIREEIGRLNQCINQFGQSIKFIQEIPAGIFKDFPNIKFQPTQFYKLLPKLLARMISCVKRRLDTTEIKPGPGTAETLNSLGLPDPSIKIKGDDDDEDDNKQGGGSSIGAKRLGITKRKKNNKILRKVNSKNKKNPRKILYGGRGGVRQYVEHSQPIPQCESTIDNYHKYVNPTCYICGEPWIKGVQSSMECEHILCVIHGIEYYGLLQSVYLSDEHKNFLSILYAWAHRCCNQRKRNIAFIRKNPNAAPEARGNYFIPDDVNIRELLSDIFTLSTYQDSNPKHKFDCNKILKKAKDNKKQFVDKRTAVVTSYVTPLVACVNTIFTDLFAANMVLFNAIGCLKIIAEMSIYLTAVGKTVPDLKLELGKTASFMSEIVFPGCEQQEVSAQGRGGRRIIHDKKTRKFLRRKIQRGGQPKDIVDAIIGMLAQEEYERQIGDFKDDINRTIDIPEVAGSTAYLSNMLNRKFPDPIPRHDAVLPSIDSTKIDAILFILFVLNHSRNPTVLLDLFLNLKEQDSIVGEQRENARRDGQDEPQDERMGVQPVNVSANITTTLTVYQQKREINKSAFIRICGRVFTKRDTTMNYITEFLTFCDMMPSFVGVVMFCARQVEFNDIKDEYIIPIIEIYIRGINSPRFTPDLVIPQLDLFQTNIYKFLGQLKINPQLFTRVDVPTIPLDNLVNACFHLKNMSVVNPSVVSQMLLHACYLFPSCFDEDIFSQFGPCAAYSDGVLENHHFQAALGCVASAKTMCARISKEVTPSKYSPDDQNVALELFYKFFDEKDQAILSSSYTPPPLQTPQRDVERFPVKEDTVTVMESTIHDAIQTYGNDADNDADNFFKIIIGMIWKNDISKKGVIPSTVLIRKYILDKISKNSQEFAEHIASYLKQEMVINKVDISPNYILYKLFPIIMKRLGNTEPDTVKKHPQTHRESRQSLFKPEPEPDSKVNLPTEVINRLCEFVNQLVEQAQPPQDSIDSETGLLEANINRIHSLNEAFCTRSRRVGISHEDMVDHLTAVITLLLLRQSTPPSPSYSLSSDSSLEEESPPPPPQRLPLFIVYNILDTYHYFQDEEYEEHDIEDVYKYIMLADNKESLNDYLWVRTLGKRYRGNRGNGGNGGGSSSHHTKRQHQKTRCKKPKIKSRRKNINS